MDHSDREIICLRIISGSLHLEIDSSNYILQKPTLEQKYKAAIIYKNTLEQASFESIKSDKEILDILLEVGLWTADKQLKLDQIPKDIDNCKVKLFEIQKSDQRREIRRIINCGRRDLSLLYNERHCFDYITIEGMAALSKLYYILIDCLYYFNGNKVFNGADAWENEPNPLIKSIINLYNQSQINESTYRQLVRNDPWRTIWNSAKHDSLFGCAAIHLTDDQKTLIHWSSLYDNIYENSECPSEEVIDDDDMLDGWLILQRRNRDKGELDRERDKYDQIHAGSDELFIPVGVSAHSEFGPPKPASLEDIERISKLNTLDAQMNKKQRMALLREKGEVHELDMPDTAQKLVIEANKAQFKVRG